MPLDPQAQAILAQMAAAPLLHNELPYTFQRLLPNSHIPFLPTPCSRKGNSL